MKKIAINAILIFVLCSYKRSDYSYWIDDDSDCQNTRTEILIERSLEAPILNRRSCKVISGKWEDEYSGKIIKKARKIDLDHIVSLKEADYAGASKWSRDLKREFANDPDNLAITSPKLNRSKGSRAPDKWLPVKKEKQCQYIKRRNIIIKKYNLKLKEYSCL